jgi:hypothetical protein
VGDVVDHLDHYRQFGRGSGITVSWFDCRSIPDSDGFPDLVARL